MPNFEPDLVAFGDPAGYGQFDIGHYREHLQFIQVLGGLPTPIEIPDYPLFSFLGAPQQASQQLIGIHYTAHELLRAATGVQGIDLSAIDFSKNDGFEDWLNYHRQEHAQIRAALGLS